jgi:transcriptional regulator with XRE-family HTH domain
MDRPTFKKHLADNLKAARLKSGRTLTQIADASGIDIATVMHYEAGHRTPDAYNLSRLAGALKTPLKNIVPHIK